MTLPFLVYDRPKVTHVGDKIFAGEVSLFWSLIYGINIYVVVSTIVSAAIEYIRRNKK